jgi:hypothetical protein
LRRCLLGEEEKIAKAERGGGRGRGRGRWQNKVKRSSGRASVEPPSEFYKRGAYTEGFKW